jgi:hypothetical protein
MSQAPRPAPFFTRRQLVLIACTGLTALAGLVWFVVHVKNSAAAKAAARLAADGDNESAPAGNTPRRDPTAQDGQVPEQRPRDKGAVKPEVTPDRAAVEALRTSLGTLTGITFRQAYLNVGLLADGVEGGVYEVADARKVLDTVGALLDTADRQLGQLPEGAFEAEDRKQVAQARDVLRLLRAQIRALRAYWANENEETAQAFQKARSASWEAIKELVEIEDD